MIRIVLCFSFIVAGALGHGRLVEPPSRSSAWRFGFNTPKNYNDNELFCGGYMHQVNLGGKCGMCGDPYDGARENEAGGKYATGMLTRRYKPGETISITVDLTKSHWGWFEFRLCANNNPNKVITQECLDKHLLVLENGKTRLPITKGNAYVVNIKAKLPANLECSQCVLQWKYNAGNTWGTDPNTGKSCVGCGPQEQFYGCSDVTIGPGPAIANPDGSEPGNLGTGGIIDNGSNENNGCKATGPWTGQITMDEWCRQSCPNHCPSNMCVCK